MKKKVGLISRISLMVALLFTAIGFSFIGNSKKVAPKVAQAYTWEEGYGMKDNSNIILSVTKVAVKSTEGNASLYGNVLDEDSEVAYTNGSYYFYRDIPDLNNDYHKTLISDGSFVKLNNEKVGSKYVTDEHYYNFVKVDIESFVSGVTYYKITETNGVAEMVKVTTPYDANETYYVSKEVKVGIEKATIDSAAYTGNEAKYFKVVNGEMVQCTSSDSFSATTTYYQEKTSPETDPQMQEAILITFGQEEFEGELYYPIQSLYVDIEHNGEKMTVPAARSEGYKRDFGFVIGQTEDNEGHYKITIKKDYFDQTGKQATEDLVFEFYIVNDTTYTGYYESNNNKYYSKPSLKLADGGEIAQTAGVHIYNQGSTSKEFPVVTYDYTLYKMTYTHTLDGATATYDYTYLRDAKQIRIVKTYKNKTKTDSINLNEEENKNILVLLLSELGDYEFSFEYIYSGHMSEKDKLNNEEYIVIKDMNESLPKTKLKINGFEVNFSKKDYYDGAEMRYFTFNNKDEVYIKIADGYDRTIVPTGVESLGIIYDYMSQDSLRTGEVVKYQDVNVLSQTNQVSEYTDLYTKILTDDTSSISTILSNLRYETTDQNPVKLKSNVDYVKFNQDKAGEISPTDIEDNQGSFYIYSANGKIDENTAFEGESLDVSQYDLVMTEPTSDDFGKYFVKQNGAYIKASTLGEWSTVSGTYRDFYVADKNYVARYTSDTSFNNAGYYLVFLAIKNDSGKFSHYQVIAFKNLLPDVSMQTEENKTGGIKSPTFTREKVKLTWEEPDTFEMGLTVRYYYKEYGNTFNGIFTDEELLATTPVYVQTKDITKNGDTNSYVIGNEIDAGESGRYLVVISNEKGNEWTTSFTIDRQDISGITGYSVFEYEDTFVLGSLIEGFISNTVKDTYAATISWNDKPSGAKVTAKYDLISFVSNTDDINEITEGKITTNFKTHNTQDGSYNIFKPEDQEVKKDNVLYNQGIYLFSFIDEAGNEAKYLLILDNTQTFFKVTKEENKATPNPDYTETIYKTAEWLQYNDVKLTIEAPRYKMIPLDGSIKETVKGFVGENANLRQLFDEEYAYIQVGQKMLTEYDNNKYTQNTVNPINEIGTDMKLYIVSTDGNNKIVQDHTKRVEETGTSVIRTYYIVGENQKYLDNFNNITASNSYVKVEINPDNSKGYVFFSNSQLTAYPSDEDNSRLTTTTDLGSAHMTNDAFVLFTWIRDIGGKYEVGKVEYDYYPLNLTKFTGKVEEDDKNYYFFDYSNKTNKVIYSKHDGISLTSDQIIEDKGRGFVTLNIENNMSKPGYYVVTRTYDDSVVLSTDSNDVMTLKYHFIVDRNGIISMVDGTKVGDYIHIGLLENETKFNSFDQHTSTTPKEFTANGKKISYNPSLETNKLPAVVNIPVGKYNLGYTKVESSNASDIDLYYEIKDGIMIKSESYIATKTYFTKNERVDYSEYYAGELEFTMYFVDEYNQLGKNGIDKDGNEVKINYPLFSVVGDSSNIISKDGATYYKLNIKGAIDTWKNTTGDSPWKELERKFFTSSAIGDDWLCLPGHYVIVIKDKAEGTSGATTETMAFEIKPAQKPETPVFVTPNEGYTTDSIGDEEITSSQQYIKVEFPAYNPDNTNAQIYSVEYNGETYYVGEEKDLFKKNGNKWVLIIDTMKDDNVYEGQGEYFFVVKYKLGKNNRDDEYKDCYYAYDINGNEIPYFENTYTVIIDRTAPQENVNSLIGADELAKEYWGGNSLFEQAYYDNRVPKTTTYFVNRYAKYYDEKSLENIFPFVVNNDTEFRSDDVVEVRYKEFDITSGVLNLPAVNLAGYQVATSYSKYSDFLTDAKKYYEILEIDAAGNITQYVVLYLPTEDYSDFAISFDANAVDGEKTLNIKIKGESDWKTQVYIDSDKFNEYTILGFKPESTSTLTLPSDKLFVMEIFKGNNLVHREITTLKTQNLDTLLKDTLTDNEYGNYIIKIHSRNHIDQGMQLNFVEKEVDFNISDIVNYTNNGCELDLSGANKTIDGVNYYISTIRFKKIGETDYKVYTYDNGIYKDESNQSVNRVKLTQDGNYILLTKTMFGDENAYPFSTTGESTESINGIFDFRNDAYYSFQEVNIKYAENLYTTKKIKYSIDNGSENDIVANYNTGEALFSTESKDGFTVLNFYPYYPEYLDSDGKTLLDGKLVKITVALEGEYEGIPVMASYTIYLDTRIGTARLTNTRSGIDQSLNVIKNKSDKDEWINTSMTSGIMNLSWTNSPSENNTFKYLLHEKIDDIEKGWLDPIDLTADEDKVHVISTLNDNKGLYAFEVQIWSKDGETYLGNKVYVFMVKSDSTKLYTVQSASGDREYQSNSILNKGDIDSTEINPIKSALGQDIPNQMLLYIANEKLEAVQDEGQGVGKKSYTKTYGDYTLTIYRMYTSSYSQYLATLQVPENNDLIGNITVNGVDLSNDPVLPNSDKIIKLEFTQSFNSGVHNIAKKNSIRMEVYFDYDENNEEDKKVKDYYATSEKIYYEIKGAGLYTFKVYDLAGNCHIFESGADSFDVYALANKEVAVLMNDRAVIENGYFSQAVRIAIVKDGLYEKIEVTATRDSKPYSYGKNKQTYTFTDVGTYRVRIVASYGKVELTKTLIFTIINQNVATKSFNLGLLDQYELVSVYNNGELITEDFKSILQDSKKGNFISYEDLKNKLGAGLFNGMQRFILTYKVSDGIYPDRTQTINFALSNAEPVIKCDLKPGESSNKQFTITYNAGLIHDEIGDATIFILKNGEVVEKIEIKNDPEIKIDTLVIKQKTYGSGSYNIRFVSGMYPDENILYSQTVELKEPLNASAIIIIVVVSAVVIAGVVVFILLRRKMRIR